MSQVILKKSSVPGKVPLVTDLAYGELAINYADGIAYFKKSDNTIGTIGSSAFSQAQNYTYTATAGQTSFACNYDFNRVYVYLNGVKQVLDTDFTASTGTSIDFVSGLIAGDIVDIVSYSGSNDIPPLPTTDIIGASDVQTLTNKTISFANNTLTGVQAELVSGTNIKTINNTSILGSGNISITETDPVFVASAAYDITSTNKTNWNSAYSWGNHASAGYLTNISSSQVTAALGYTPINAATKGAANGIASLDSSGLVPSTQLPSYVDDVLEYANLAAFPATGETGKIYVALDTNKTYRWSGSTYVYITSGAVDSVAGKTGVVTLASSDVGLGSVENKSSATIRSEITSSNVTTALGFTPYNSTNPSGFITSSALSPYQLASTAITTSNIGSQSVNYATTAGSAATLTTPRNINGSSFNGSANIIVPIDWTHSGRDFPNGTLIETTIDYSVTYGDPWVLEIRGNSYGNLIPFEIQYQGYIYNDTVINHGGYSVGTTISGLVLFNYNGKLCFWFPSQGYWHGYYVKVYTAYATYPINRVSAISNLAKPTPVTKEVALSSNIRQILHSANYNSYSPTLTGTGASGTWGINISGNAATASNGGVTSVNGATGAVTVASGSLLRETVFTTSGTWTKDVNTKYIIVEVVGGGGGGSTNASYGGGGGGGAGGYARKYIDVSSISSVTVTIGSGGAAGVAGGTSYFGSYITCYGGGSSTTTVGGSGGTASGGDLNCTGNCGINSAFNGTTNTYGVDSVLAGAAGGASYFGGSGKGASNTSNSSTSGTTGSGGGGRGYFSSSASSGGNGLVIVTEFA